MNTADLTALLDCLRAEPRESEQLEFKTNRYEPQAIGEYLSALADSTCLLGKPRGYLAFGIEDGTHAVVGTSFDPQPETGQRIVLVEVHPAFDRPVEFYGNAFVRNGSSKTALVATPRKSAPSGAAA